MANKGKVKMIIDDGRHLKIITSLRHLDFFTYSDAKEKADMTEHVSRSAITHLVELGALHKKKSSGRVYFSIADDAVCRVKAWQKKEAERIEREEEYELEDAVGDIIGECILVSKSDCKRKGNSFFKKLDKLLKNT